MVASSTCRRGYGRWLEGMDACWLASEGGEQQHHGRKQDEGSCCRR